MAGDCSASSRITRIARWRKLLVDDPQTPYRKAIETEIGSLCCTQIEQLRCGDREGAQHERRRPQPAGSRASSTRSITAPSTLARREDRARRARSSRRARAARARSRRRSITLWLYARAGGEPGVPPHRAPSRRRALLLPRGADRTRRRWCARAWSSGTSRSAARPACSRPAIGSQQAPRALSQVDRVVAEGTDRGESLARRHALDYVDFDGTASRQAASISLLPEARRSTSGNRSFLDPIYAGAPRLRHAVGQTGGPKSVIDAAPTTCLDTERHVPAASRIAFSLRLLAASTRQLGTGSAWRYVAVMLPSRRPACSTTDTMLDSRAPARCQGGNVAGCNFDTGLGARGRLRLGEEAGTGTSSSASRYTKGVGAAVLGPRITPLAAHGADGARCSSSVQVTDQPVIEDFGVRDRRRRAQEARLSSMPSLRVSQLPGARHQLTPASPALAATLQLIGEPMTRLTLIDSRFFCSPPHAFADEAPAAHLASSRTSRRQRGAISEPDRDRGDDRRAVRRDTSAVQVARDQRAGVARRAARALVGQRLVREACPARARPASSTTSAARTPRVPRSEALRVGGRACTSSARRSELLDRLCRPSIARSSTIVDNEVSLDLSSADFGHDRYDLADHFVRRARLHTHRCLRLLSSRVGFRLQLESPARRP